MSCLIKSAIVTFCHSLLASQPPTDPLRSYACDLTSHLPRVILIGELHTDPNSTAVRLKVAEAAARGKYPAAIEPGGERNGRAITASGAFMPWDRDRAAWAFGGSPEKSLLTGIESPIPDAVFWSYTYQMDSLLKLQPPFIYALNIAKDAHELPLFSAAIRDAAIRAKASPRDRITLPLIKAMDELGRDDTFARMTNDEKLKFFRKTYELKFNTTDFEAFVALHHAEVINIANSKYLDHFEGKTLPVIKTLLDRENFGCQEVPCQPKGRLKRILTDQRSRDFASSIAEVLCQQAGKFSDVVVDVGSNHVVGIKEWLNRQSRNRVEITEFHSDQPSELPKIATALDRIRPIPAPLTDQPIGSRK